MINNEELADKITKEMNTKDPFFLCGNYVILRLVFEIFDFINGQYGFPKKRNLTPELLKIFTKQEVLKEFIPIVKENGSVKLWKKLIEETEREPNLYKKITEPLYVSLEKSSIKNILEKINNE